MAKTEVNIPMQRLVGHMTITVNVTGVRAARMRLWIGIRLIRLAALIIGCGIKVDATCG